jgi:hypothetical protein
MTECVAVRVKAAAKAVVFVLGLRLRDIGVRMVQS